MPDFLRKEGIAAFAALAFGFSLFEGFENFLQFCEWLQPLIFYWRFIIYNLVDGLLFFLPFKLPRFLIDTVLFGVFVFGFVMRAEIEWDRNRKSQKISDEEVRSSFYLRLYAWGGLILAIVFILPVFGEMQRDKMLEGWEGLSWFYQQITLIMRFLAFIIFSIFLLFVRADDFEGQFREYAISRYCWRTLAVFSALLAVNGIGLYADKIAKIEKDDFIAADL